MAEHRIGTVVHYYGQAGVAGVMLEDTLEVGDTIHVVGHTTDIVEPVGSIEIDHHRVDEAHRGDDVGIKIANRVREHDLVFRVG